MNKVEKSWSINDKLDQADKKFIKLKTGHVELLRDEQNFKK